MFNFNSFFRSSVFRFGFVSILICIASDLFSQNKIDTTKDHTLDYVIITASKSRFGLISPLPVQTLAGKDLERISSLSVADAIRYFSGVQLKDYGGIGGLKTANVRSLGTQHLTTFYDGVPIGNAQNGQTDLGKYSLDNIGEIQLYNGQKSTIFQPARGFFASSSLYLKSKTPDFKNKKTYEAKAGIKGGTFGLINPSVLWHQKLSNSLSLSANAEWLTADGKYKFERKSKSGGFATTEHRQNTDIEAIRIETGLFGKVKQGEWNVKAYLYDSERGLPDAIASDKQKYDEQRQWDRNIFLQASYTEAFSEQYKMMANIKAASDYLRYINPNMILSGTSPVDNRYTQNEYYISLVNQYSLNNWWDLSLATDFTANTLDANLAEFAYPERYSSLAALSSHMRFEKVDFQASLLGCMVNNRVKDDLNNNDLTKVRPALSLSYQPFNERNIRLRAFYKQSMRVPSFNDLYYTQIGNSNLKPEYTTQYDLGFTWLLPATGILNSISLQGDVFYNEVDDLILAIASNSLFRWSMVNMGKVKIKGVELNGQTEVKLPQNIRLNIGVNYTYKEALDMTQGSSHYGNQMALAPKHSASANLSANWREWQFNYSHIYMSNRYYMNIAKPDYLLPAWSTSDISFSWEKKYNTKNVRLGAEVNNLLNQQNEVIKSFPLPGRSFRFTLSVSI